MSFPVQLLSATLSASLLTALLGLGPSCSPSTRETPAAPAAAPAPAPAAAPAPVDTPPAEAPPAEAPPAEAPPAEAPPAEAPTESAAPAQPAAEASHGPKDGYVKCPERRSNMCTKIYLPVCAEVDTGIRCVRAPCPSIEQKTYASDCTACSDPKVIGHRPGACKAAAPGGNKPSPSRPTVPGAVAQ